MRAKQPTTQYPQSSLAQTILPSAANDRGRKSRGAHAPEPAAPPAAPVAAPLAPAAVPASSPAPMEFAGAPARRPTSHRKHAAPPAPAWAPQRPPRLLLLSGLRRPHRPRAPVWAPPPSAPARAPAPDWGTGSASRFGNAPAAFGSAPANPQFASAPVTDYPTNYPAAPGFPPQPHYTDTPGGGYLPPAYAAPPVGPPGYGGYPTGAPQGRSTASRVVIGVAIAVVALIAIGVAIPVFLSQRKPVPVTLVLPQSLEGSTKLDSAAFQQVDSTVESTAFADHTVFTEPQAAFWGNRHSNVRRHHRKAGSPSDPLGGVRLLGERRARRDATRGDTDEGSARSIRWNHRVRRGDRRGRSLHDVPVARQLGRHLHRRLHRRHCAGHAHGTEAARGGRAPLT